LQNSFKGDKVQFLFLLVETFLKFAENSFEGRQAATCCVSKEFGKNPVNVPTERKKGIKIKKRTTMLNGECKYMNCWQTIS
jgi:hypothetical protein